MPTINFTKPLMIALALLIYIVLVQIANKKRKSMIIALMLFTSLMILIFQSAEYILLSPDTAEEVKKTLTYSIMGDMFFIYLSFISYLYLDKKFEKLKTNKPKKNKNNKKEKNKNTNTKTGGIIDNIKTVTELLKENKSVLTFIFRQIKLLFRHVLPGSHVIDIRLGLDDPAMLGEILGAAAVVRASTGLVINISPVWDEAVFEADADLMGRIILGRVLFIAARV